MPELPEVETTRRGISPWLIGQRVASAKIRNPGLRWPIPDDLADQLIGGEIKAVRRRSKYLLVEFEHGTALIHLGMSGSLRLADPRDAFRKHDHWCWTLDSGKQLRYHDPRRFGALLWLKDDPLIHPLLAGLGPEPLQDDFTGRHLWQLARGRKAPVKNFIMDAHVVVGVGNIYASESLYRAGIHPARAAGRVSQSRYDLLADSIVEVLREAIDSGGSTLRDYVNGSGNPGYFQQKLDVYGRSGEACRRCGETIASRKIGQRSSFYCPACQR